MNNDINNKVHCFGECPFNNIEALFVCLQKRCKSHGINCSQQVEYEKLEEEF